jgi:MarR family
VSVLDQFRTAEHEVAKRLRELKPLAAEYHELEQIAQRLGLSLDDDATPAGKRRPASPKARRRARASTTKTRAAVSTRDARGEAATAKASVAPRRARSPRRTSRNGRASSSRTSRRQQDVLHLVHQRPGITVREIAKELGIDATGLYRPVHKLEQDGAIIKRGVSLQPTSA